jgi:aminoglycoside phosphotransferase (APT) family kinase protein
LTKDEDINALVRHHFGDAKLDSISKLAGGVSAEVYRLTLTLPDGHQLQITLRAHGPTHGGHEANVEFQLLAALHAAGLAVPKPLAFDESLSLLSHPYLLLAFVEGSTAIPSDLAETYITAMADQLAAVHNTATTMLPKLPLRLDPVPELLDLLPPDAEWRGLRQALARMQSSSFAAVPHLLHGDFWPGNVIWQDGKIAAILDWEDAAIGDPLSDVACSCLELRYIYGQWGADCFKKAYAQHRSLDLGRFALWQAYVAAAAHHHMGEWRLEPSKEVAMRQNALESIREAARALAR